MQEGYTKSANNQSGFKKPKRSRLQLLSDTVANDSKEYENGKRDFSGAHGEYDATKNMKDDLKDVYTKKFVPRRSPGRVYYTQIISAPKNGTCPICGVGYVSTLDHYLPKSHHPTLCITPANLIPSCRDCNVSKRDNDELTIHMYFDDIPDDDPWLYAEIQFQPLEPKALEIRYFVDCPTSALWSKDLVSRIRDHFKVFKLNERYVTRASDEIANLESKWKGLLPDDDEANQNQLNQNQLKEEIEANCKSAAATDINSWRSALYRALLSGFKDFYAYLKSD